MHPISLERAAAVAFTRAFVDGLHHLGLDISLKLDQELLVEVLVRVGQQGASGFHCLSSRPLQKELQTVLARRLDTVMLFDEAPVWLTCMLALCRNVTATLADMPKKRSFLHPKYVIAPSRKNEDKLPSDTCRDILEVIGKVQRQKAGMTLGSGGGKGEGGSMAGGVGNLAPLHTKSLMITGLNMKNSGFLARLVQKMPFLQQISVPDFEDNVVVQALSRYCRKLQKVEGIGLHFILGVPSCLIPMDVFEEFCNGGEKFRRSYMPKFPDLRMLDCVGLCVLSLLLQPKLEFQGRNGTEFTLRDVTDFCLGWRVVHGPNCDPPVLSLKHAIFTRELCRVMSQPESVDLVWLFRNISCVELEEDWIKDNDGMQLVEKIVQLFSYTQVSAMSLPCTPSLDPTVLMHLQHLRLWSANRTKLHIILDSCHNLRTLSVEHLEASLEHGEYYEEQFDGGQDDNDDRYLLQVTPRTSHTKLTTLRIGIVNMEEGQFLTLEQEEFGYGWVEEDDYSQRHKELSFMKAILHSFLIRLPNLRSLCLSCWTGQNNDDNCITPILKAVLSRAFCNLIPMLQHLEELCCLGYASRSGDESEETVHNTVLTIVRLLPAITHLVLPTIGDVNYMDGTIKYLQGTHIEVEFECRVERVFYIQQTHFG